MKGIIFVPARSGSVGIKNKNLKLINKKPLLYYTLQICKKLKKNYKVFISTDSNKIANYCKRLGFNIKYRRPKKLSTSKSNIVDAVVHGINWYNNYYKENFTHVILLQPTSPIRKLSEIKKAISIAKKKKLESLASISKVREHSLDHIKIPNKNSASKWKYLRKRGKNINFRQQHDKNNFLLNGSIYIASISFLKKYNKFVIENKTYLLNLSKIFSIDVDYWEDLFLVESILRNSKIKKLLK